MGRPFRSPGLGSPPAAYRPCRGRGGSLSAVPYGRHSDRFRSHESAAAGQQKIEKLDDLFDLSD
jgi:hypothetical protein